MYFLACKHKDFYFLHGRYLEDIICNLTARYNQLQKRSVGTFTIPGLHSSMEPGIESGDNLFRDSL